MPRPKGSKNKKSTVVIEAVENIDERIAAVESTIAEMTENLKAKKAELKELTKAKAEAEKLAAEKRVEEERTKLLEAIAASGKSVDEIISLITSIAFDNKLDHMYREKINNITDYTVQLI